MRHHARFIEHAHLLVLILLVLANPVRAGVTAHLWSRSFGVGDGIVPYNTNEKAYAVAVDGAGNVLITGELIGADFGGGLLSGNYGDVFIAKFNAAGVHQWSQKFGGQLNGQYDAGRAVAVDAAGNVLLTGSFTGTVNFGGSPLASAGGGLDIFLAKYDSNGVHQWSQRFGNSGLEYSYSVAVDGSGNVLLAGSFTGTTGFGGANLVSAGDHDAFLAMYSAGGVHQWSQRFGSTSVDAAHSVAVDGAGDILLTGYFGFTANFGGSNLVSAGDWDIFLAKYNSAGTHQWSQRFGGAYTDQAFSAAVDGSGNVITTGSVAGTVDLGGGSQTGLSSNDIFLAKYNSGGIHQWSQIFGISGWNYGTSVAVDSAGSAVLTGRVERADFGGGTLSNDIFVAKYSSAGLHQWSRGFDTGGLNDRGTSVAADGTGDVLVTGHFRGTVNFGGSDLINLDGPNGDDIFLAKFASDASEPVIASISDVGNDQGRLVNIRFLRSGFDTGSSTPILWYEAYRRDDPPPSLELLRVNARPAPEPEPQIAGWTYVGSAPAHEEESYGIDAPTIGDSTAALGPYFSVFFIRAATGDPGVFYDSDPDSGYSLDNLAPGVPASFAYNAGQLTWDESTAADFDYFAVYGSNTNSFAAATLIDYTVAPAMGVTTSPYFYYFVTGTDFSGNEGPPAVTATLTDVGGTPRSYVLSVSAYPNPFNPETTIRYTVPSKGRVTIAVHDARGALIATLLDEERETGAYTLAWDGRDADGNAASSGVYFARVAHPSGTKSYKMVLLK